MSDPQEEKVTLATLAALERRMMEDNEKHAMDMRRMIAQQFERMTASPLAASSVPLSATLQTPRAPPIALVRDSPFSNPRTESTGARRPLFLPTQQVPLRSTEHSISSTPNVSTLPTGVGIAAPSSHGDIAMEARGPQPLAHVPRLPHRKVDKPKQFTGTALERLNVERFLNQVRDWLDLAYQGEEERTLVVAFGTALDGPAATWYYNLRKKAAQRGIELTLQQAFDEFLMHFDGGRTKALVEQEFNSLMYGKGACKDLPSTEIEFDRLASLLYPGAEFESESSNALLARHYSEIIRKGNFELWEKTVEKEPYSLEDWKACAQRAQTVIDLKNTAAKQQSQQRGFRGSYQPSTTPTAASSTSTVAPRAFVHQLQHKDEDGENFKQEGEQGPPEELAEIKAESKPWPGDHLKRAIRIRLMKLGKCWLCYKRAGHLAVDCPEKDKLMAADRRQPTKAELKE
jgi:hypothetical protein